MYDMIIVHVLNGEMTTRTVLIGYDITRIFSNLFVTKTQLLLNKRAQCFMLGQRGEEKFT